MRMSEFIVREAISADLTATRKEEVIREMVGNLHRAYRDLEPGRPDVDLYAALTDMVAYNGGRPLSCRA